VHDRSTTGLRAGHVRLVAGYWARFSLRTGGGLMCILVVLIVGLAVAATFITPLEILMKQGDEVGHTQDEVIAQIDKVAQSDQVVDVVTYVTGSSDEAAYLLRDQPALFSAILVLLLFAFPFMACQAGFNQTSGDIGNRGLRYLLLRTERANIFLGRFLGAVQFLAFSSAVLMALLVIYVGAKFGIYAWGDLITWGAQGFLACMGLAIPYLAMSAWISGGIDSPFGALTLCVLLTGFPILFLKLADATIKGEQDWLMRLLPWGWKFDLLSSNLLTRLLAFGMMAAFTAFFLWIGFRHFHKRDL
jgi:ABC-type transport system involved in multi-copper enzyme maturation permease subunit